MKKMDRFKRGLFETLDRRGRVTSPPLMENLDIPIKNPEQCAKPAYYAGFGKN